MTSSDMNAREREAEVALEARVEAARSWTPQQKVRFWKQTVVMLNELVSEARWRAAVFNDLFEDLYPPGCGEDCFARDGRRCARCMDAQQRSRQDPLLGEACRFIDWDEEILGTVGDEDLPDPDGDGDLWAELERRLTAAGTGPSDWVRLNREARCAATRAATAFATEGAR